LIAGAVAVLGFVLMLGTAGLSDNNLISTSEMVARALCGMVMMVVGFIAYQIINEKENA
jgi:hypothetical protein